MASNNGHTTTVNILLERGANPNIANNVSEVFLPFEVQSEHTFISCDDTIIEFNTTIVELLLKNSAGPNIARKLSHMLIQNSHYSTCTMMGF